VSDPYEDEDEERPWERRGSMRLDCEPHRARLVLRLGLTSLVLGALSLCFGLTGLLGLPLGLAAWYMARQDVLKMQAGLMDRRGEKRTRRGGDAGLFGAILSLLLTVAWAGFFVDRYLPPPYGNGP
jgi:hypothetical protein